MAMQMSGSGVSIGTSGGSRTAGRTMRRSGMARSARSSGRAATIPPRDDEDEKGEGGGVTYDQWCDFLEGAEVEGCLNEDGSALLG